MRTLSNEFRCGGTLITDDTVVTAAHCVSDLPSGQDTAPTPPRTSERFMIRAGPDRTAGQVREVTAVHLHPGWNWQQPADDIALLLLAVPVRDVETAILGHVDPAQPVEVLGWGYARPALLPPPAPQPPIPARLHAVDMRVIDCQREGALTLDAGPHETCLGALRVLSGPCPGDSGSPGLQGRNAVAVVSRGFEPCGLGAGGVVMTSLSPHAPWVHQTAALGHYQRTSWTTQGLNDRPRPPVGRRRALLSRYQVTGRC